MSGLRVWIQQFGEPTHSTGSGLGCWLAAMGLASGMLLPPAAAVTHYVDHNSPTPTPPYLTWETAATTIQDAVDAASSNDTVLVTNGVYDVGGTVRPGNFLTNRVVITNEVVVRSVNGPQETFIVGQGPLGDSAVRGVYMSAGVLDGFTITNGHTRTSGDAEYDQSGGGINLHGGDGVVSNCVLIGNAAEEFGGGSYRGTLTHCTFLDNLSESYGGGSGSSTLNHCTLVGNHAARGGGTSLGTLSDCMLTSNTAFSVGGGSYSSTLSNCTLQANSAGSGGGSYRGELNHCTLTGNSVTHQGGGSYDSTLNHCALTGNTANEGGGSYNAILNHCALVDNSATENGGGMYYGTLTFCTLAGNSAGDYGGGSFGGTLNTCRLTDNSAGRFGGGSAYGTLKNCALARNSSGLRGGGSLGSTLNNCTLTGNSADEAGGGTNGGVVNNCIVYFNTANGVEDNWNGSTCSYSCTTPDPGGTANITNNPQLISDTHITTNSPCRGAGSAAYASGVDIDGESWLTPPSMGCDENAGAGTVTGAVSFAWAGPVTVVEDWVATYSPIFEGPVTKTMVDFRNGLVVTNYPEGGVDTSWSTPGVVEVLMTAWNDDHPSGIVFTQTIEVLSATLTGIFVSESTGDDANDGSSWATAKQTIQAGVDAQDLYSGVVWVTNGVYALGGGATPGYSAMNRVVITNDITVRSVNGPGVTSIVGEGPLGVDAVRGVYMSAGVLTGFTVTNGHTRETGDADYDQAGGGLHLSAGHGVVNNCVIAGNAARFYGGGTYYGTVNTCTLRGNSVGTYGGGSYWGTLNNCHVIDNQAGFGGGSYGGRLSNCTLTHNTAVARGGGSDQGTLNNCIVYFNSASLSDENWRNSTLSYSCTFPDPGGTGNIADDPQLVTFGHIATNSPCRGAGNAAYASGEDIDGEPWLNPPSMGCDEYTGFGSVTGEVTVTLSGPSRIVAGRTAPYVPVFRGPATLTRVDFGNGLVVTNHLIGAIETAWTTVGTVPITLTAYNDDHPGGIVVTHVVEVVSVADAAVYVSNDTGDDANDGRSWSSAKQTIQGGVDVQDVYGGTVWVTNGAYAAGGAVTPGHACLNRVVITREIDVRSVNGSAVTHIVGEGPVGSNAVRGVYMSAGVLDGFTVTNGHTLASGDVDFDRCGGGVNLAGGSGVVSKCTLTGNAAGYGGGGSYQGTLSHCRLTRNSAGVTGGGSYAGTLTRCELAGNSAANGGGGSSESTLHACSLIGNSADVNGGGSISGTLNHCTLTGNSAKNGGGSYLGTLNNCIVYWNTASTAGDNWRNGTLSNSCTVPDPGGTGNITNAPLLVSGTHIATNSPCRGAGDPAYSSGTDFDGEPWLDPPSIGCDENAGPGGVTGTVAFALQGPTQVIEGRLASYQPRFDGPVTKTTVDFDNGLIVTNHLFGDLETSWPTIGDFQVRLTAWNDDYPSGLVFTQTVDVFTVAETAIYVSDATGDDANDGRSWGTAKQTLQAGVDAQVLDGGVVWVTNGVYDTGGAVTPGYACMNRVAIDRGIDVRSVNGPQVTTIVGEGPAGSNAVRGVYLSGGSLNGFTVTHGHTMTTGDYDYDRSGGGVFLLGGDGVVDQCVLIGNAAGYSGGGSHHGTLNHCVVADNSAGDSGGGSAESTLNNCTISGNSAALGGGIYRGSLSNCVVYFNTASVFGNNWLAAPLAYCCTVPLPGGAGNITTTPHFVDASAGNYRLLDTSPCIDAGDNASVMGPTDLDGQPRIVGVAVDMGAYESWVYTNSDADGDGLPDWWENLYFGGPTNANPTALCNNGVNTVTEAYIAGLSPIDPAAAFTVQSLYQMSAGVVVTWDPVSGRVYSVSSSTNLGAGFSPVPEAQLLLWPQSGFTTAVEQVEFPRLYRVEVRMEE